jgi:transcriptional regulator of acetoin/glycerol metabolism
MHVIERSALPGSRAVIEADDLGLAASLPAPPVQAAGHTLADAERAMIRDALSRCHGNIHKAAEELGLSRAALYRRLQKLGIQEPS